MKVGDLIEFTATGYQGIILEFTRYNSVSIFITNKEVNFANPTLVNAFTLPDTAKVISRVEGNP